MSNLANPTVFVDLTRRALPWLAAATAALFAVGLTLSFMAPPDYQQGETRQDHVSARAGGLDVDLRLRRHGARRARHARLAPSAGRRGAEGRGAARRGLHLHLPRHRLAVGQADVGNLLGMGRAPDLGAGAVPPLSRPDRAVAGDRGPGPGGARGGDPHPGRLRQPADHQILGRLVEHAASAGLGVPPRRPDDRALAAVAADRHVARLHLPVPDAASDVDPQRDPAPAHRPRDHAGGGRGRPARAGLRGRRAPEAR